MQNECNGVQKWKFISSTVNDRDERNFFSCSTVSDNRGSVLWNKIATKIREMPSLKVFKTSLNGKDYF